jgi:hypothetical protein
LLRAGVIPRLKGAGRNWIVVPPVRPRLHPVDELATALATARDPPVDWATVRDDLIGADPGGRLKTSLVVFLEPDSKVDGLASRLTANCMRSAF